MNPRTNSTGSAEVIRAIVDVKLDIEHKLEHGLSSSYTKQGIRTARDAW